LTEPPKEFAQQLRSLREAQGLSVRSLASLLGVSKVTVWKWEKGDSRPRPRFIVPLARALDVAPVQLRLPEAAMIDLPDQLDVEAADALELPPPGKGEPLPDVIERAKRMIAEASGVGPKNITISIEY